MSVEPQPKNSPSGNPATPALDLVTTGTTGSSCCGGAQAAPAPTSDDTAECPVMTGTPVNKAQAEAAGLFRDYNGTRYWFCCAACGPVWDADPEEFATV